MSQTKIIPIEYKLSIMKEESEDRFFPSDNYREKVMGISPKHWNEYVSFDLKPEEVIEILAVISRMRGTARGYK